MKRVAEPAGGGAARRMQPPARVGPDHLLAVDRADAAVQTLGEQADAPFLVCVEAAPKPDDKMLDEPEPNSPAIYVATTRVITTTTITWPDGSGIQTTTTTRTTDALVEVEACVMTDQAVA